MELKDKVIIVTGAGSGIGRASAIRIAAAGARVVVSDLSNEGGLETVSTIRNHGGHAEFVKADMGQEADVAALMESTLKIFGRLHGAFNNAGIVQTGKSLHTLTTEEWERALRIDLTAVFWCIKYEVLAMLPTGGGAIVNTASSLAQVAIPGASEYIAAKHGVLGLTRAAAAEYGSQGIRVNAILPGIIETPVIESLSKNDEFRAFMGKLRERHPIGRFGQPNEIGEAALWLLSPASSFVNGAAIAVDGGYLAV